LSKGLAALGARITHGGAGGADLSVERRASHHELGVDKADVGAVHHETDVFRSGVAPPELKTMGDGFDADFVAVQAGLDAAVHLG